jgi:hypothetical protein
MHYFLRVFYDVDNFKISYNKFECKNTYFLSYGIWYYIVVACY